MKTEKILVIDDNDGIRNAIQYLLEKEEYIVIAANNGPTGLKLLHEYNDIQVVIIDLAMLGVSGVEVLKIIKEWRQPLQRIVLTAHDEELPYRNASKLMVYAYLNKPVTKHSLLFTVQSAFKDLYLKELEKELGIAREWEELGRITGDYAFFVGNRAKKIDSLIENLIQENLKNPIPEAQAKLKDIKEIVKQIVEFQSIVSTPFIKTETEEINVNEILDDTIKNINIPKEINIIKNFDIDEPKVIINSMELRKVIEIIINNAVEAMEDSEQKELAIATIEGAHNTVRVKIKDTGTGIGEEDWEYIFHPFHSKEESDDKGFGLFTAKNILAKYKSTITFKSKIGAGTTFTIKIPLKKD